MGRKLLEIALGTAVAIIALSVAAYMAASAYLDIVQRLAE